MITPIEQSRTLLKNHSPNTEEQNQHKLTVLVAAWNESKNLGSFIQSYLYLDYPKKELVLCAGGTDGTYQKALEYASDTIKVLQQFPGEGKQRALRKGFERATGEIIVLTDADCLLNQESLDRLIHPILNGDIWVASGHCKPKSSQLSHPFVFYQYALQQRWEPSCNKRQNLEALLGRNCALQRIVLEQVGAFDEDIAIGTDSFLAKKLLARGYKIRFVPDSVVETDFPTNMLDYIRQKSRWSRNGLIHNLRFRLYRRIIKALLLPLRGLALCTLPFFGLWFSHYFFLVWISFFAYSYLLRSKHVYFLRKSHTRISGSIFFKIIPYILIEWAAPTLGLFQLLDPRGREQW